MLKFKFIVSTFEKKLSSFETVLNFKIVIKIITTKRGVEFKVKVSTWNPNHYETMTQIVVHT